MSVVFVEAETAVGLPFATARRQLERAIQDGGLVAESRRACEEGLSFFMRVGPAGARRPGKEVLVQLLPCQQAPDHVIVPLRWAATGAGGSLFPSLDANVALRDGGDGASVLSIVGAYRPPLGVIGAGLDRAVLSKAARATLRSLLDDIASTLLASSPDIA